MKVRLICWLMTRLELGWNNGSSPIKAISAFDKEIEPEIIYSIYNHSKFIEGNYL